MHNLDQRPLDEKGKAHGEWRYHWDNGRLNYRLNFFHGAYHGLQEGYLPDGILMYRGYRNMDRRIGHWYHNNKPNEYYLWVL